MPLHAPIVAQSKLQAVLKALGDIPRTYQQLAKAAGCTRRTALRAVTALVAQGVDLARETDARGVVHLRLLRDAQGRTPLGAASARLALALVKADLGLGGQAPAGDSPAAYLREPLLALTAALGLPGDPFAEPAPPWCEIQAGTHHPLDQQPWPLLETLARALDGRLALHVDAGRGPRRLLPHRLHFGRTLGLQAYDPLMECWDLLDLEGPVDVRIQGVGSIPARVLDQAPLLCA